MATDIELTAISGDEEELEEGEIDSSDGEEDKEQPEGSDKPPETVNNTPEPNEQRDTRKRELSPAQNEISPSSRNEKRAKIDQSDGETNLEDGEIFSDDEEAAYYPQLVRSRNKVKKDKKERTPSPSLSHSPVSHSDDEQRTHRETDRHSRRDKKDSLDVHRPYGRYSQNSRNHRSPHRSPRRDTPTSRDRFSGGRTASRNSNTHNLIGQPIRHDRTSRWEEPSRGGANTVLTPQIIESRLKQGLSLLQTPRTNPIYSLDELNYPAAPQWYMKSVYAYNRRTGQRRGGGGPIGGAYRDYRSSYPSVGVNRESTRNGDEEDQVNEEVRGVEESKSLEMVEQVSEDEAVPMDTAPPVIAVDSVVETTQSVPAGIAQPLPSSEDGPSDPPSTSTNDLKVSIPLSQVAVTTHPVTPTENSDFNYDDYLDQLIDEEDGDTTREVKATDSNIPSSLPDKFWIDTGPVSDSKPAQLLSETGFQPPQAPPRDPLEEDFPSVTSGGKAVSNTNDLVNNTLRALVNQDSIDDTIASEEGKDVRQSSKKPNKSARRKQKDRLWLAKQEAQEKREQDQFSKPRQPCKYFQSGYCIHGDNCQYSHDVVRDKKKEVCKFYLQDGCSKGDNCLFYHGEFPCKFHHTGVVCYHGDSCKFSHAPLTKDTYDMLMAVVDPSLRDKVPLPGHPPPSSHNMQHQLSPPLMQPPLLPQPDFHHQQQPQAPPRPLMGAYPPPPGVPPLAPPQQWMGPPTPQDPPGFRPPLPMAPPPHQQWTGTPAPFPPGPHPLADGMGLWQEPPPPGGLPPPQGNGVPPASAAPEGPKLDANVPLPQGFDVKTLFPDPHPQILPHDLATKLRKTLLPTPSNTNVTQPTLELEYWEHQDQLNSPPGPGPVGPPGGPPQQQPFLPPPGPYHGPPQSGFSPPHDPYQQPPPIHRPPPSQPLLPGPPSAQSQQDPRFSRQRPPYQPQPAPQGPPYPLHGGPAITGPPNQFIPQPAVPTENPVSDPRGWAAPGTRPASDPPSTGDPRGDRAEPAKRSIDPRLKYAHLKIKSRSNTSASTATTTSSTHTTSDSHSFKVPGLLQDRSQLSKPLALHELFGGAEEEQSAEQQPISLFGSSKYYHKTNSQSIPTSPITNKQGFGEIIMDTSGPLRRKSLEDKRKDSLTIDETNEEENDFVPSYLTHLGLEKDSDTSGLKIDSAFGDLKERQRRLSEIGSSLSEESRDEVLGSPKNGSPRLTRTFSFGSNL